MERRLWEFQSTLPTRGSDVLDHSAEQDNITDFNPRSPRGGATPWPSYSKLVEWIFQSTLPTRGSDGLLLLCFCQGLNFNPRSPRGGATGFDDSNLTRYGISIHAPHEGERQMATGLRHGGVYISIHAPHEGERHNRYLNDASAWEFQSTLPTRGSDHSAAKSRPPMPLFQSTLPTRGSDHI